MKQNARKGRSLFSAVCWTVIAVLWTVTTVLNFQIYSTKNVLPYLNLAVVLASLIAAILHWRRWAAYHKNQQTNEIVGG